MHAQPGARSCSQPAIGGNHYGPVLIYMAKVADAKTATSGSFFKVAEDGYTGTTASWGTEVRSSCPTHRYTLTSLSRSSTQTVESAPLQFPNPSPLATTLSAPKSLPYMLVPTTHSHMSLASRLRLLGVGVRTRLVLAFPEGIRRVIRCLRRRFMIRASSMLARGQLCTLVE
jgi:hypothetical protein